MRRVTAGLVALSFAACHGHERSAPHEATQVASEPVPHDARPVADATQRLDAPTPWTPPPNTDQVTQINGDHFWIDRTEVTVKAYRECVDAAGCSAPVSSSERSRDVRPYLPRTGIDDCNASTMTWELSGHDDYPINCVTFMEAWRYCKFRGGQLPDDYAWRRAAAGDHDDDVTYPWGQARASCARAVIRDKRGMGCGRNGPWPVGSKPAGASPFGALDMAGNLSEIVVTYERPSWESVPIQHPMTLGGSYADDAFGAHIDSFGAQGVSPTVGFRCVYYPPDRGPRY